MRENLVFCKNKVHQVFILFIEDSKLLQISKGKTNKLICSISVLVSYCLFHGANNEVPYLRHKITVNKIAKIYLD